MLTLNLNICTNLLVDIPTELFGHLYTQECHDDSKHHEHCR